jgi:hypothetical protein
MKTASGDRNLREVEAALREHPSIDDCVVLVRKIAVCTSCSRSK